MMLGVKFIPHDRFILHRFLTDAVGHFIGSYLSIAATYAIDPKPTWEFNHGYALALAAAFILSDFVIARFFGNRKWFGLTALASASVAGYLLFMFGAWIRDSLMGTAYATTSFIESGLAIAVMSVFFLPPALLFPLIIRLMAYPIIGVFRPRQ
jgi:hypothetical protein